MINNILILRDFFIRCYQRFDFLLKPALKFLLAFIILLGLQSEIGYFTKLNSAVIIAIFALLAAFFPPGCISFAAGIFLILDMLEVSYVMASVGAGVLVIILLLYYGFKPGTGIVISIVPFMFFLGIPQIVPAILGLTLGIYSAVPAVCGVIVYNLVRYFSDNASTLALAGTDELVSDFLSVIRGVLADKYMIFICAAFVAAIIIVSVTSKSSIRYSRLFAVTSGILIEGLIFIAADIKFSHSVSADILGTVVSLVVVVIYVLIFYAADYRGTERLEFEDDDYFYYVKAVPKIKPYDPDEQ